MNKIERTIIGSLPKFNLPLEKAIENAVDMQLRYDIDIISDGEQRGDMIEYFEQIIETDEEKNIVKIKAINMDEFYKIIDYYKVKSYLNKIGKSDVKIKIALTGPITLGHTFLMKRVQYQSSLPTAALLNPKYKEQKFYSDVAEALVPLAKKCLEIGAYVQIDEPGISSFNLSPSLVRKILTNFFKSFSSNEKISIHVCGPINKEIYKVLLELNVKTISLEFGEERENMNLLSKKSLENSQKLLGVGFIPNSSLESVETSLERLKQITSIVGMENIAFIHPDCGFRNTKFENVETILDNMRKSSEKFMKFL